MKKPLFRYDSPLLAIIAAFALLAIFSLSRMASYVFWLEVAAVAVSLILIFKATRLFVQEHKQAFVATSLSLIPILDFMGCGSNAGIWTLPFAALALLLACRYHQDGCGYLSTLQAAAFGLLCGTACILSPFDGALWVGGLFVGLLVLMYIRRQLDSILRCFLAFLGGMAAVAGIAYAVYAISGFSLMSAADRTVWNLENLLPSAPLIAVGLALCLRWRRKGLFWLSTICLAALGWPQFARLFTQIFG